MKIIILIALLMSLGSCASVKPSALQPEKYCGVLVCYTIKTIENE